MSYIDNNLLAGETILFRTKKHFIIFFVPVVLFLFAVFLSLDVTVSRTINTVLVRAFSGVPVLNWFQHPAAVFLLLISIYSAIMQVIMYLYSDYVVTNTRVIMREGLLTRYVCDMRLNTVANVSIDQNIWGQLLNYGFVVINGFGGKADYFSQIAKPAALQKAVNEQLDARNR